MWVCVCGMVCLLAQYLVHEGLQHPCEDAFSTLLSMDHYPPDLAAIGWGWREPGLWAGLPLWHQCCLLQPTLYQIMEAGRPVAAKHSSLWLRAHFPTSSLHQHCPVWLRDSGRNVLNLTASRDSLCVPGKGGAHINRRVKSPRVGWNKNCKGNLFFCRFLNYKWVNVTYKAAVFNAIFRLSKLDTRELKELRGMVKNACTV